MPRVIDIRGAIVPNEDLWIYELFDMDATSPGQVAAALAEAEGEEVTVNINSGGGDVTSGSEIYTMLRSYEGGTLGRVVGLAASAASVIAMGCTVLEMSPTAELMIHNAWTYAQGDNNEMNAAADRLRSADRAIAAAYRAKSGMSEEELLALMKSETWLTAEDAKAKGLADAIMFESTASHKVAASAGAMLPQAAMDAARLQRKTQAEKDAAEAAANQPVTRAELDELKGEILAAVKAQATVTPEPIPEPVQVPKQNRMAALFKNL